VTPKPALDAAVTAVTAVTAPHGDPSGAPVARRWRVEDSAGVSRLVTFIPAASRVAVLVRYPGAQRVEPLTEPIDTGLPPSLARAFDSCVAAGRCSEDEREILVAMAAVDESATRVLLEAVRAAIGRCPRCVHHARPGLSDSGYCSARLDLPRVYGLLHRLPADEGRACDRFEEFHWRNSADGRS
jgi:hypothetical protein